MGEICFVAGRKFVTLGKTKKHRIIVMLANFFEEKNFQLELNKRYQNKSVAICDLGLKIKCNRET